MYIDFLNNKNENSEGLLTAVEGENVTVVKCESPSLPYSTYLVFGKGLKFVVTGFFGGAFAFSFKPSTEYEGLPEIIGSKIKSRNHVSGLDMYETNLLVEMLAYHWLDLNDDVAEYRLKKVSESCCRCS